MTASKRSLVRIALFAGVFAFTGLAAANAQVKQDVKSAATKTGNAISDSWITMKVHAQFFPEKALDNSDINVDTNKGIVTLRGTVASEAGRDRAVAIAKMTDGVKDVTNQLTIAKPAPGAIADGWVKTKIYSQFLTDRALDGSEINIDVDKGAVTLRGTARSAAARQRAVAIAKGTEGAKSVRDMVTVSTRKSTN